MKKLFTFVLIIFFFSTSYTQNKSEPKDVRLLFPNFDNKTHEYISKNPDVLLKKSLKKAAWGFYEGFQKNWWAHDLHLSEYYNVPSTCRKVGAHCYVFVEDAVWETRVNQNAINNIANSFDNSTPANPEKGIYQTDVETFGYPPNVDGDDKIVILVLDIREGYSGGGYVAGYFSSWNQTNGEGSNQAEIYYLDANPLDLLTPSGLEIGMSTTAHEFQHMIHFNYNLNQVRFINEALSECASVINGYPFRNQDPYNAETNHYLLDFRAIEDEGVYADYSRAARYSLYLWEQFSPHILKYIVVSGLPGIAGVNWALSNIAQSEPVRDFSDALEDWFIANELNNTSVDTRLGYTNPNTGKGTTRVHINPNVTYNDPGVYQLGVQYISFTDGGNLLINFNTNGNSAVKIKAIKEGATTSVETINPGIEYNFSTFGTEYSKITFAIYTSLIPTIVEETSIRFPFSYTASGTFSHNPCPGISQITYLGKTYYTVQIGDQCWLNENLNVGTMVQGNQEQTNNETIEKYCYNNDENNCNTYGGLYQWNEAMAHSTIPGAQGICPTGWHIPTLAEFQALGSEVSNSSNALKAIGQGTIDGAGTNTSGFSALIAGLCAATNYFMAIGAIAFFWSSTEYLSSPQDIYYLFLTTEDNTVYTGVNISGWRQGISIRCINDLAVSALPVALNSFTVDATGNAINLKWSTATEVNNYGFEIERSQRTLSNKQWVKIGFVNGHGNSNSPKEYNYIDKSISHYGKYIYRLKQIDFDGKFEYSEELEIQIDAPIKYSLYQNYPNPFNPITIINYELPIESKVTIKVFDLLGREIGTLIDRIQNAGNYKLEFDGRNVPSGIYFYKINAGNYSSTRKMLLIK